MQTDRCQRNWLDIQKKVHLYFEANVYIFNTDKTAAQHQDPYQYNNNKHSESVNIPNA